MAKSLNQIIYKIHIWLGLVNGLWLLLLGFTGAILVFGTELDNWIHEDILTVKTEEHRLSYDSLYKIVRAGYPTAMGTNITRFPSKAGECISFRVYVEDGTKPMRKWDEMYYIDINPYNGHVLREGNCSDISQSFILWCTAFHWNLQFGNIGTLIVTIAGLLLFINILTGVMVYKKYFLKALIFRAPVKWRNWRTTTSGLHRYIGVWSILFNILIFYSGLQMTWSSLSKEYYQRPEPLQYNMGKYASIDTMINEVQRIYPGFEAKYFYIPFSKVIINGTNLGYASAMGYIPGTPSIVPLSSSHVDFDINTGKIVNKENANESLHNMNAWDQFNFIAYSFHAGTFLGMFSRVLYVVVGLTPSFLALSGFLLWWRRKQSTTYHPKSSKT